MAGVAGYNPLTLVPGNPGEIPEEVQAVESGGEAHHDFVGKRSKPSVVYGMNLFFARVGLNQYSKSEEITSESLHIAFNGGIETVKADLRLSTPHNLYNDADQLARDLFVINGTQVTNVKPLVFMISLENLERGIFNQVFNELKRVLSIKYNLRSYLTNGKLSVTHDAYKFDGIKGNPMDCNIMFSAATACDPQVTGEADMRSAIEEGRFISPIDTPVLVYGQSYWGNWNIETPQGDGYMGATIIIGLTKDIGGVRDNRAEIRLSVPRDLLAGPSVLDLATIYDKIVKSDGNISPADMRVFIGDISIKRNKPFSGSIRELYIQIINEGIRLFRINVELLLRFIFIIKEIGDMSQHKVGVIYKHLALGSVDGLSTVAFLKRDGSLSYIPKEDKYGNPCILFRCAGTVHISTGLTEEQYANQLQSQRATILREYQEKLEQKRAKAEAAKERGFLKKVAFEEARRLANQKLMEERERKAAAREARAARGFGSGLLRGAARKRKQTGGYKRKTFKKQRGGALNLGIVINALINSLFMNLYYTLTNPRNPTSLFNINTLSEEFIDFTLVGVFPEHRDYALLDNKILGLPLCSIIYILYETLEDLDGSKFDRVGGEIITSFLIRFNFTEEEIYRIQRYMADIDLDAKLKGFELPIVNNLEEVFRPLTQSDKDTLRSLDAQIPGIIPYDYYIRRSEAERAGTSYETLTPAEIAMTQSEWMAEERSAEERRVLEERAYETNDGETNDGELTEGELNDEVPLKLMEPIYYIIQKSKASKAPKASKKQSPRGPKSQRSNLEGRQNKMRNESLRKRKKVIEADRGRIRFGIQEPMVWARKTRKQRK